MGVRRPYVTIREVARLAGVHPATVSRALNVETRKLVNEVTARRVEAAARDLEYQPNHSARSLKTRRSMTIGVLIPDLTNPIFPPVVRGIDDGLAGAGYVALVGNTDMDKTRERLLLSRMQARHVDGFILATAQRRAPLPVSQWGDVPVVLVNRVTDRRSTPSVATDDVAGVRLAVGHLVDLGHRRIASVAGPQMLSTGQRRHVGFVAGMRDAGLDVEPGLVGFSRRFSEDEGFRVARELLSRSPASFTAIVAGNDMLALGCLRALASAGRRCPDDISLVGFNDMAFVDRVQPPLTTIRVPQYRLGHEAAELMLQCLGGSVATKAVLLTPELIVRASTAAVDPGVHQVRRRHPG